MFDLLEGPGLGRRCGEGHTPVGVQRSRLTTSVDERVRPPRSTFRNEYRRLPTGSRDDRGKSFGTGVTES